MLSFPELLVILIVAVIVLGPKRLPEAMRKVGHCIGMLRRVSEEFKRELTTMDRVAEDTLNRSVVDFDQILPDKTITTLEGVEAEITDAMQAAFPPSFEAPASQSAPTATAQTPPAESESPIPPTEDAHE